MVEVENQLPTILLLVVPALFIVFGVWLVAQFTDNTNQE